MMEPFLKDLGTLIEKHGVGTFVYVFKDPDSDGEFYRVGGSLNWCQGALAHVSDVVRMESMANYQRALGENDDHRSGT